MYYVPKIRYSSIVADSEITNKKKSVQRSDRVKLLIF